MSKQANPTVIGTFVVGAIVLLVIATVLFGGADLFVTKNRFVTYFEGSVKGLRVGANVTFRGVRIGYVTDIQLRAQVDSLETLVPVTIEVVPGAFQLVDGERVLEGEELVDRLRLQQLITAGLRAQLNIESYVTGQLLIEMDFLPDQPIVMRGTNPPYPEIPTIPDDFEQAIGTLERLLSGFKEKIDIDAVIDNFQGMLKGLDTLANSPELHAGIAGLSTLINASETQQLSASISTTARELDATLKQSRGFMHETERQWAPVAGELQASLQQLQGSLVTVTDNFTVTLQQLNKTLQATEHTAENVDRKLRDDSEFSREIRQALREFERASRAIRVFAEYIDQHPEAILRGKQQP
ncbi:MAG: MlaD family protein [Gammaproteobacteria bacterium]|jgi:paraquat-inducible protein B